MRSGLEHFFCFFILNEDNLKQYSLVFSQVPPPTGIITLFLMVWGGGPLYYSKDEELSLFASGRQRRLR